MTIENPTVESFIKKHKLTEEFLVYSISSGLRQLQDDDLDEETKESLLKRFAIEDDDQVESLISEVDDLSWEVQQENK